MPKAIIRNFEDVQDHIGDCSPEKVEFIYGEIAVDVLDLTTAEELLGALCDRVGIVTAKAIVEQLLNCGLLFDSTIESEVRDAR